MKNSSRVLWKSSPQLLFSCWHSVAVFSHSISSSFFFSPVFTCRVTAGVSKGGKKLTESIEAMRKLTTTGWLVLLFCLETNAALSLLEKRGPLDTLCMALCFLCCFYCSACFSSNCWSCFECKAEIRPCSSHCAIQNVSFRFYSGWLIWMEFKCWMGLEGDAFILCTYTIETGITNFNRLSSQSRKALNTPCSLQDRAVCYCKCRLVWLPVKGMVRDWISEFTLRKCYKK